MTFTQLIIRNFRGNFRSYGAYFISNTFAVWIFFTFSLLLFHPQLNQKEVASSVTISELAQTTLMVSLIVIGLLSLLFLGYTFTVFLKRRKRDMAIYILLGIESNDLRILLFLENSLLGLLATVSGILLGLMSNKLLLLIIQNLMHLQTTLRFELSVKAIVVTFSVFSLLFLLISFISTRMISNERVMSLLKENERPRPAPKAHVGISLFGLFLLFGGYASVLYVAMTSTAFNFFVLLAGVLLTIIGTFISFQQFSVFILTRLKKRTIILKGTKLLTLTEWIHRIKDNANMYSLITISTSVAFVGIALMLAMGGRNFASIQDMSVAYVFSTNNKNNTYLATQIDELKKQLDNQGYQYISHQVETLTVYYSMDERKDQESEQGYTGLNTFTIIREMDYLELMKQIGQSPEQIQDGQLVVLSHTYSDSKRIAKLSLENRQITLPLLIDDKAATSTPTTVIYSPNLVILDSLPLCVVTDRTFEEWKNRQEDPFFSDMFIWLDYPEWADNFPLTNQINQKLDLGLEELWQKSNEKYQELGDAIASMSAEEIDQANPYANDYFRYASKAKIFQMNREQNGLILTVTVLIGTVFFVFSASIIYFRLFEDFERDLAYHRKLHFIGVSDKERHHVLKRQLQMMFLLPTAVAMLHFAIAMLALRLLVPLPVWMFYTKIVVTDLIAQIIFYWLCSYQYRKQMDQHM